MKKASRSEWEWTARWTVVALALVTGVLLARPLLGLGSLLPADIVEQSAPWRATAPVGQSPQNAYLSDTIDVHTHFASLAGDLRTGNASWWDRSVGGGIPSLKAGFSPLMWVYLVVPAWYAPGLVAAVRTLLAAGFTYGLLRELRAGRAAATLGGVAYALSGYMVGWAAWPQSNVAAFLPALFWAVERLVRRPSIRSAVPLALAVSAMVVSNFPVVTAYGLLAGAGYGLWRAWSSPDPTMHSPALRITALVKPTAVAVWGLVLAGLLSSLHILAFGEYFDWADNRPRENIETDSSIGADYLLSIPLPRPYGAHHTGTPFWREGQNWVETQSYSGLSVVILAAIALATRTRRRGGRGDAAARAGAVRAMWAIAIAGAWLTYVGGPPTQLVQSLPLLGQNSVGRARVVINLALAVLAGLGLQAWLDARRGSPGVDLGRGVRTAFLGAAFLGVLTVPLWWRWSTGARDRGLLMETVEALVIPILAAAVVLALLWRYRPAANRAASPAILGAVALAAVAVELMVFALPVATVVDRDQANLATPAHEAVADTLDPGERLAGDSRSFFANTGQITGVDDARGHLLTPAGWREIYRAIDPDHFEPPGSVTNPWFDEVDVLSPALDRIAVGVWAADPALAIAGSRHGEPSPISSMLVEPGSPPVPGVGSEVVPPGGLRALTVELVTAASGELVADVTVGGENHRGSVLFDVTPTRNGWVDIAIIDVAAPAGSPIEVEFSLVGGDPLSLAADATGVTFATVAAGDGLRLVRAGDVVLYERESAEAARLVHAVVESDSPVPATVHLGELGPGVGIVPTLSATGLPAAVPEGATGSAVVRKAEGDKVIVDVTTSEKALVVIAQPHYPGWRASVDGEVVLAVEIDGAFPGVLVEPGRHVVELEYRPTHLSAAFILTMLGGFGMAISWWLGSPRRRRSGPVVSAGD